MLRSRRERRAFGDTGLLLRLARCGAVTALVTGAMLASPVRLVFVAGRSMTPTLQPLQPLLYRPSAPAEPVRDGDIVVLRLGGTVCVKRIYATGGEDFWTISLPNDPPSHAGIPLRRGSAVSGLIRRFPAFGFQHVRLATGQVFVMGENSTSLDSRDLGPVSESEILGRVIYPWAPPQEDSPVCYDLPPPPSRPRRS